MRAPRFRTLVATPVVALILLVRLAVVGRWRAPTSSRRGRWPGPTSSERDRPPNPKRTEQYDKHDHCDTLDGTHLAIVVSAEKHKIPLARHLKITPTAS